MRLSYSTVENIYRWPVIDLETIIALLPDSSVGKDLGTDATVCPEEYLELKKPNRCQNILFLCSDNYYRSRFAENFFNWLASEWELDCLAESRGFQLNPKDVGSISRYAVEGLAMRGIEVAEPFRYPMIVQASDFEFFDLVVAVNEVEHRPFMMERFPTWADQIEYWNIHDIDVVEPDEALLQLDHQVRRLVERLRRNNIV